MSAFSEPPPESNFLKPEQPARVSSWAKVIALLPLVPVLGLVIAAVLDGQAVKRAFVDLVVRLLAELNLKVVIGLGAAAFATVLWRAVITEAPRDVLRVDFDRHWGGLGSGEGGTAWRIEWPTVRWLVHAIALIGLYSLAVVSLFAATRPPENKAATAPEARVEPACACPAAQAGAAAPPLTAAGAAGPAAASGSQAVAGSKGP